MHTLCRLCETLMEPVLTLGLIKIRDCCEDLYVRSGDLALSQGVHEQVLDQVRAVSISLTALQRNYGDAKKRVRNFYRARRQHHGIPLNPKDKTMARPCYQMDHDV